MSITFTPATWAALIAQPDSAARAQALVDLLGANSTIEFLDATDTLIRTITVPGWAVGATANGKTPIAPSSYTDAATGSGTPVAAVFKAGATEVFRCSCGTGAVVFYRLLANIVAGVPIIVGAFAILVPSPAEPGTYEPSVTTAPVIAGTAQVGAVLTATAGVWSGNPVPVIARQWLRSGVAIAGATGATYLLVQADLGATITLRETATNTVGSKSSTSNGIGPIAAQPLAFTNVPSPIDLPQGGSYDLGAHVAGGIAPYSNFAVDTGSLPVGVTIDPNTGVLAAAVDATLETTGDLTFGVDDSATPVSQPGALPTFGVTSAAGGVDLPFTFGHVFKRGQIAAGQHVDCALADFQEVQTAYWSDGSLKHAVLSGRVTAAASADHQIALSVSDTSRSGVDLTEADLLASLVTGENTIEAGVGGQVVDLRSLVGAPHSTLCIGPIMSSWVYRAPISGQAFLEAWFEVRVYKGSRVEVFPWIERTPLTTGTTNDVRTWTLRIAGQMVFSRSIDLKHHTRIPLIDNSSSAFAHWSYWIGGDPMVEPVIDTVYWRATKLVPNYGFTTSESTLAALRGYYTPTWVGNIPSGMGSAGYSGHIGILPHWQAAYLSTGDLRGYRATMANAMASGSWSIAYRDETTHKPFRFSDYPKASIEWSGTPSIASSTGGTNGTHDEAHQPSLDYLPWLISGRWWHLDQMLFWNSRNYLFMNYNTREQASGIVFSGQIRARGWIMRTLAQLLSALPTSHPCFSGVQNQWQATVIAHEERYILGTRNDGAYVNALGVLGLYSGSGGSSPYGTEGLHWWDSSWMQDTMILALGEGWNLDLPQTEASRASHKAVRDHGYKHSVGLAGDGSTGNYNWRYFGCEHMPYATDAVDLPPEEFLPDWGAVLAVYKQYGGSGWTALPDLPPTPGAPVYLRGSPAASDSWGYSSGIAFHVASLAMAVEHGAAGAAEGWARITGSSNYQSDAATAYATYPTWSIQPRVS